jgi:hypothetical protein
VNAKGGVVSTVDHHYIYGIKKKFVSDNTFTITTNMTNNIQLFNINSLTLATLSLFKCVYKAMRGAEISNLQCTHSITVPLITGQLVSNEDEQHR